MTKKALNMRELTQISFPLMSEVQNPNTNSTQQQQQQQQQSYSDSKINSAESERLYLEMKEAWL